MLFLIFADRHDVAVVNQNVSRHKHRIIEKSNSSGHAAGEFVFVRVGALEQAHGATVDNIHASSVTCGTSEWRKSVARCGSSPHSKKSSATRRVLVCRTSGSRTRVSA